jgi:hypothetical protein
MVNSSMISLSLKLLETTFFYEVNCPISSSFHFLFVYEANHMVPGHAHKFLKSL